MLNFEAKSLKSSFGYNEKQEIYAKKSQVTRILLIFTEQTVKNRSQIVLLK